MDTLSILAFFNVVFSITVSFIEKLLAKMLFVKISPEN
jgi:hypothetical protein